MKSRSFNKAIPPPRGTGGEKKTSSGVMECISHPCNPLKGIFEESGF
jgi:hypothetical protein